MFTQIVQAAAEVAPVYGMTASRVAPTIAAVLALGAAVASAVVLGRGRHASRRAANIVTATGAVAALIGLWFWVAAGGGPGTGNGMVAAWGATGLGIVATGLGLLARTKIVRVPAE